MSEVNETPVEREVIVRLTSRAGGSRDLRPVLDPERPVDDQAARVLDFVMDGVGRGAPFSLEVHDPDDGPGAGQVAAVAYEVIIPERVESVRVIVRDVE